MVERIDVSVIIVCMNKLNNLFPCLESIYATTCKVKYEIIVVAYLFSDENLKCLSEKYPNIKIIESKEIRGFSENNNLALRVAQGDYCFILNDDTLMKMPVIDKLIESIKKTPEATVMSPVTLFENGNLQSCGRPKMTFFTYILTILHLWNEQKIKSKYTNQKGIFQSYNIVGAAFLIKTSVMKEVGGFDETYFFCPEDIALSTLLNKKGYKCFVDEEIKLYHLEGKTRGSVLMTATLPAATKGSLIFYSGNSLFKKYSLVLFIIFTMGGRYIWNLAKSSQDKTLAIKRQAYKNVIISIINSKSPKEIFIYYYNKI